MIKLIIEILQNFSVYKLGWFSESFSKIFGNWQSPATATLIGICVFLFFNFVYFIYKYDKKIYLPVYIPICIGYMILNIVFHLFLSCVLLTLGPIVWGFLGILYCIFAAFFAGFCSEEYEDLPGYFNIMLFVIQYPKKVYEFKEHTSKTLKNYQKFLNIKYE